MAKLNFNSNLLIYCSRKNTSHYYQCERLLCCLILFSKTKKDTYTHFQDILMNRMNCIIINHYNVAFDQFNILAE